MVDYVGIGTKHVEVVTKHWILLSTSEINERENEYDDKW